MNLPFLWGAATSSHQIEGHNIHNDWWKWEHQGFVEGGVKSGATTDHWHRSRQDLDRAQELGLNTYRFSVEWSRLQPEPKTWDHEALAWYRELIHNCEQRGLVPMLTLHHFTSPQWFAALGGFTSDRACEYFSEYVQFVVRELGARVPLWCTLNEPMVLVAGSYLGQFMPPGRYDPRKASLACQNLLRCHVLAYDEIHRQTVREGPWREWPRQVGIAHNMLDFHADRAWHPLELTLRRMFHRFYNQSWLDAICGRRQHFGALGLIPFAPQVPEALGRCTADFIGVNYYTKGYVQWRPRSYAREIPPQIPIHLRFSKRGEPISDLGWVMDATGLFRVLEFAWRYRVPLMITENGVADHADQFRARYIRDHLTVIAQLLERGVDIRGYYHWSLLDNFEWIKGFGPRFGLYSVDYDTFERQKRPSAQFYQEIIAAHQGGLPPSRAVLSSIAEPK